MRNGLHYVTWAILLVGVVSRIACFLIGVPGSSFEFRHYADCYSLMQGSYVILATVAWSTCLLLNFPLPLLLGSAANVTHGIYRDHDWLRLRNEGVIGQYVMDGPTPNICSCGRSLWWMRPRGFHLWDSHHGEPTPPTMIPIFATPATLI